MRKALVISILSVMAAAFGSAQSAIAANPKMASAVVPAVYDQVTATICSGGPPEADEIRYDDGHPSAWYYYMPRRARFAVRMDPAYYPAIVAQCDVCVLEDYWPPPLSPESIYVQIWFDRNGDGLPDFPAVWGAWAPDTDTSVSDTAAVTVQVPLGQVICNNGSFWVSMMMDTVHEGATPAEVTMDDTSEYPDHEVYYDPAGDTWGHWFGLYDLMIRSWTYAPLPGQVVCLAILAPSGEIREGDSVVPRVILFNAGSTFNGWVWMRIRQADSTDGYVDSDFVHILPSHSDTASFRTWVAGSPGLYPMQCTSDSNDTVWPETIMVLPGGGLEDGRLPQSLGLNRIEVGSNPIRSEAAIRYSVAGKSRVLLRILDARGTVVRTLVSGHTGAGEHTAVWDTRDDQGRSSPRGIYFVRLESQDCQETRKVILAR
jgi:hypothetical protein